MKKPIIGIVGRKNEEISEFFCGEEYRQAIIQSGGIPILLLAPYSIDINQVKPFCSNVCEDDLEGIHQLVDLCDGILFPGGSVWYGFDQEVYRYAYEKDKPILGICLGMQMIACSPFFHLKCSDCTKKIISYINHQQQKNIVHQVQLKTSLLKSILGTSQMNVNSRHSYTILTNDSFHVSSYSSDGMIESIEIPNKTFIIGVQWHPESLIHQDFFSQKLFYTFIQICKKSY